MTHSLFVPSREYRFQSERIIKYDEIDEYGDDDWNLWYTPKDRRFLYRILMDTLSPAAKDIVERQDKNGILVFRFFFKRWGTPTISNSISALQELIISNPSSQSVVFLPSLDF